MFTRTLVLIALLLSVLPGFAADEMKIAETIRAKLEQAIPGFKPDFIEPSPVPGLYQVGFGTQIVYVTEDGRYAMQGAVIDLDDGRKNITEVAERNARLSYLKDMKKLSGIVFSPENVRHSIYVFTDIDCPYCVKLHKEMAELNSHGVEVKYLLFPRAGVGSPSYKKAVNVWCSNDRNEALTLAKSGEKLADKECENSIAEQYLLGQKIGVSGTPAIVLEDGSIVQGYQPAEQLAKALDAHMASK